MVLVDTSAWVAFFARNDSKSAGASFSLDEVVTCPMVVQEVLQGFKHERAFRRARRSMLAFPIVESPAPLDLYEEAADLYRLARKVGLTIRSSADCLIAACAIRNDLTLLHWDRDFEALTRVSNLRVRSLSN